MVLIDSSAFIEFLNHTGSKEDRIIERFIQGGKGIALPVIAVTEILQGIRDDRECEEVKSSLLTFPLVALENEASYIAAAELYRKCRKKGHTIRSTIDILIAQIAMERKMPLLHRDGDFGAIARVSELEIYSK